MTKKMAWMLVPLMLSACASTKNKPDAKPAATNEEDDAPALTKPKVRSFVVPDTIEGNKYIKSHRVYILEDPGTWSR